MKNIKGIIGLFLLVIIIIAIINTIRRPRLRDPFEVFQEKALWFLDDDSDWEVGF